MSYIDIKIFVLCELCSSRIKSFMFNCFNIVVIHITKMSIHVSNIFKIVIVHRLYNEVNTQGSFFKPLTVQYNFIRDS